jgi:hypothetical protein
MFARKLSVVNHFLPSLTIGAQAGLARSCSFLSLLTTQPEVQNRQRSPAIYVPILLPDFTLKHFCINISTLFKGHS